MAGDLVHTQNLGVSSQNILVPRLFPQELSVMRLSAIKLIPSRYFRLNLSPGILRQTREAPNQMRPEVTETSTSQALKTVNFAVGFALLVMLFPIHGVPCDKPAGVRTAIEAVSKKTTLKALTILIAAA